VAIGLNFLPSEEALVLSVANVAPKAETTNHRNTVMLGDDAGALGKHCA
jgi:hypothetical protein